MKNKIHEHKFYFLRKYATAFSSLPHVAVCPYSSTIRHMKHLLFLSLAILLGGCVPASEQASADCLREFPSHDIRQAGRKTHTLSETEWTDIRQQMRLTSVCIPSQFGAPFVNVDWNAATGNADSGRKIVVSFEKTYDPQYGGWGNVYLEYSTYDFSVGSEYRTLATDETYRKVKEGTAENTLQVPAGMTAVVTYVKETTLRGDESWLEKHVVFPFDGYYIAAVYKLQGDYSGDSEMTLNALRAKDYPSEDKEALDAFDRMVLDLESSGRQ